MFLRGHFVALAGAVIGQRCRDLEDFRRRERLKLPLNPVEAGSAFQAQQTTLDGRAIKHRENRLPPWGSRLTRGMAPTTYVPVPCRAVPGLGGQLRQLPLSRQRGDMDYVPTGTTSKRLCCARDDEHGSLRQLHRRRRARGGLGLEQRENLRVEMQRGLLRITGAEQALMQAA